MRLESVPAGAQVVVGGAVLGKTPFRGTLPRRSGDVALVLVLRLAGYADKTITVHGDKTISERVPLVKATPARSRIPERDKPVNPFAE